MHILLFGGSFNPPHLGHAIVIEQAFELIPNIGELWILPTYNHAFGKDLAPANDRLAMCQLLVKDLCRRVDLATQGSEGSRVEPKIYAEQNKIKVCSLEIDNKSEGSTYHTLQSLKSLYPQHTFSFLMGSDQLPTFNQWNDWEKLLEEMHFFVYPRGSHRHKITFPNMELLESPTQVITNISSTLVRHRLENLQSITRIINPIVMNYISDHQLYSTTSEPTV